MKTALICGVSGQDGAYLAQLLLRKGYHVTGTSRDAQTTSFRNLQRLGIDQNVALESVTLTDFRSVLQTIAKVRPDEIYNLAGQSSVGLSFQQPVETLDSISVGTLNLLEAIRFSGLPAKIYNAGSCESFGDTGNIGANENTPFRPKSPYAVAKAAAYWTVANYREAYGLFACSGILFNHESPLRHERFVTQKIVATVARIYQGHEAKLVLGNTQIQRDWGWAPEYVEAMWLMLQQPKAADFVIATGETYPLESFICAAFAAVDLNWRDFVVSDQDLFRPTDVATSRADPRLAASHLGWAAKYKMEDVARMMITSRLGSSSVDQ